MAEEALKSFCNSCSGNRRHRVRAKYEDKWHEEVEPDFSISGGSTNYILECAGCGHISFRSESWDSEDCDPLTGRPEIAVHIYPKSIVSRTPPSWFDELSFSSDPLFENLNRQLGEIYKCYDSSNYWVCVMGVRAAIETLMLSKINDEGAFAKNLGAFSTRGFIGEPQRLALEQSIDLGSAAIHRGTKVSRESALEAIQILENVVESVIIQPIREARLKKK